jgi:carbon-monoxide dehydrogenase large subunit
METESDSRRLEAVTETSEQPEELGQPPSSGRFPDGPRPSEIGQPRRRVEDGPLVRGEGRYVDDLRLPDMLHVALVRSPHPAARVGPVDTTDATQLHGVQAVATAEDADLLRVADLPANEVVPGLRVAPHGPLAKGWVRAVGEPVAAVIAESSYLAADAAQLIMVDYEPLDSVSSVEQALELDAPLVQRAGGFDDNVAFRQVREGGDVQEAFASADHVVRLRFSHSRVAAVPVETRGVVASWDEARQESMVWTSTQTPHWVRSAVATSLGLAETSVRVIAPDVGGAFGSKAAPYREEVLVAILARRFGRPVKWIATRSEEFLTSQQSREEVDEVEAAVRADGRVLGLRVRTLGNVGAYLQLNAALPPVRAGLFSSGCYDIPAVRAEVVGVFTNTAPTGPYRGAGRPEAAFIAERVMDEAALLCGLDPVQIRRRNFIRPDQFPYRTALGQTYDSGNYDRALQEALRLADYDGLQQARAQARARGGLFGIGLCCYVELAGVMGWESGTVRVERDGRLTVFTGSSPHGQGHETVWAQLASDSLGVPFESVTVRHGDTAAGPPAIGSFGGRSAMLAGSAIVRAAERVREKAIKIAAHLLESGADDVEWRDAGAAVRGAPDRAIALDEITRAAYGGRLPPEIEPGLEATAFFQPSHEAFSFGAYLAAVRIDQDTGRVQVVRLVAVDDCGPVLNPLIVEGQVHGGLTQGLGQALLERVEYDPSGTLLSGSLLDYAAPLAKDVPEWVTGHTVTPSPLTPTGVKGVGEAGTIGAPPAIVNAALDALRPLGVRHIDMPLTAGRVWAAIRNER